MPFQMARYVVTVTQELASNAIGVEVSECMKGSESDDQIRWFVELTLATKLITPCKRT